MTYAEKEAKRKAMYAEHERLVRSVGHKDPAAVELWRNFFAEEQAQEIKFGQFCKGVADRVIKEKGFKLSKAQRAAVEMLIREMIWTKLGREWMLNHCEYHRNGDSTVNWVFDAHYDKGTYFVTMNTKTLEKGAALGLWEIVTVGHSCSDTIKPCFDFDLIESI